MAFYGIENNEAWIKVYVSVNELSFGSGKCLTPYNSVKLESKDKFFLGNKHLKSRLQKLANLFINLLLKQYVFLEWPHCKELGTLYENCILNLLCSIQKKITYTWGVTPRFGNPLLTCYTESIFEIHEFTFHSNFQPWDGVSNWNPASWKIEHVYPT